MGMTMKQVYLFRLWVLAFGALLRTIALTNMLTLSLGVFFWQIRPSFASNTSPLAGQSLEELQETRSRLITQLETPPSPSPKASFFGYFQAQQQPPNPEIIIPQLQAIEAQILLEKRANDNWQQALHLATEALETTNTAPSSVSTRKKALFLWQQAINNLQKIPETSLLASKSSAKIKEYQQDLQIAIVQLKQAKSSVLAKIAQESGLSQDAMITVCRLTRDCVHLHGNNTPTSPASLIKVPIAVALMHKVKSDKISLEQTLYVQPGNFTEDNSSIQSSQKYPLKTLVQEMIDHSSNIATNELIDYLGYNYINQVLANLGYDVTRVNFKLMGDQIMPSNPGQGKNSLSSDELTEMMVKIYNQETPGSKELKEALSRQRDRKLGFAALEGKKAKWLGEKTGENSLVLGTTVALSVDGEPYIVTIIDNQSGIDEIMRNTISKIADYIINNGHI